MVTALAHSVPQLAVCLGAIGLTIRKDIRMNRALLSLWIGAMALSGCQSVSVWTSDELRQTFIGNTLAAAVSGGEVALYLEPDGAYVTTFSSGVETGTWTISDTALCLRGAPGDRSTGCWRASGTPDQVRFESDAITFYGRIIDGRRGDLPEAITAARLAETARQREAGMAEAALDDRPAPLPGSTRRPGDGRTPPDDAVNRHLDRWGTGAAPAMITAGPKTPLRDYPPYEHKTGSGVIRGAVGDSVLAPLDMALIGFSNRSAARRGWQTPYDDLELCFESRDRSWPGLILCVYHLADSPLLTGFPEANGCSVAESWSGDGPAQGRLFFAFSERRVSPGEVGISVARPAAQLWDNQLVAARRSAPWARSATAVWSTFGSRCGCPRSIRFGGITPKKRSCPTPGTIAVTHTCIGCRRRASFSGPVLRRAPRFRPASCPTRFGADPRPYLPTRATPPHHSKGPRCCWRPCPRQP